MVYTEKEKYKKAKKTAVVLTDTKKTDQEITKKTQPITQYTIQPGETLMAIAQKNRLYVSDLKKWNNLSSTNIEAGQKLRLTAPTADETTVNTTDNTLYTVKKGDNIYMIARNNNINIEDIKDWNNLDNNNLKIGDQLKIKNNLTAKQSKKISQAQHLYIVQKGDSLFSISQKLKKSVAEIKKQNNLKDEGIVPGMKLKV
jgi:membrane-bound lytic murein transglycosylase D